MSSPIGPVRNFFAAIFKLCLGKVLKFNQNFNIPKTELQTLTLMDKHDSGNPSQSGDGTGKKRRVRGDPSERNYTCGCGKSYLSYPALYTHIKTKHDGVTPAGTSQPQTNGKSGRGRPKKEESAHKLKEEDKTDQQDSHDAQAANEVVLNYLRVLGTTVHYDEVVKLRDNSKEPNGIVSTNLDTYDLLQAFPLNILHPGDYEPVYRELEQFVKTKQIGPEEIDKETDMKKTQMDTVFAFFAYIIGRHIREPFFKELIFFLIMYRKAMNELGWRKRAEIFGMQNSDEDLNQEYCAVNNAEIAPEFCNELITEKWAEYLPNYDLSSFKVLGTDVECTKNAVFLTQHFCNWLNSMRYTNSKLAINEENGNQF